MSPDLEAMAAALVRVPGVAAVGFGGSRARGEARPDSDWDLGVYYREPLDLDGLRALAAELTGGPVEVEGPGGWGPWSNGGAWLTIGGDRVDWILRDLDRVLAVWRDCQEGRYEAGHQPGRPLGFWSTAYPAEVALSRVLADVSGELSTLRAQVDHYPEPLRAALITDAIWEARFTVYMAGNAAPRGDVLYVSLCLSRAVGVLVQALFAAHRRWCSHEKGSLEVAGGLPGAPEGFAGRAAALLAHTGATPGELTATVEAAQVLVTETRVALRALAPLPSP